MGGASRERSGHRPQRANHSEPIQTRHSATPLETPPRQSGNSRLVKHKPACSSNDAARMQKFASWYRKSWIVLENGGSEHRTIFPASRTHYGLLREPLQVRTRNDEARMSNDEGMTNYEGSPSKVEISFIFLRYSSFGFRHCVADGIEPRLRVFPWAFATNWTHK